MKKGSLIAWLPVFVFLALFIGFGAVTGDFYLMPAYVGFFVALAVAFCQNPKMKIGEKMSVAARGSGEENIMVMCLIFLLAGAFSSSVTAAGGSISAVNFGLSILPANMAVVGIFLIGCLISISMGTSVGTIVALTPIAVGISEKASIPVALCVGAVICGAMFGDNLSMISDTTIAATRTQDCAMNDKFKENFKIVLPAAIVTFIIFFAMTFNASYAVEGDLSYDLLRIAPYALVLITALLGVNVFVVLTAGTVFSLAVGMFYGDFGFMDIFTIMGNGMSGMFEIAILSMVVGAVFAMVRENGGIDYALGKIKSGIKTKKGAEMGIAAIASIADIATANNTVAIVIAGPIAKEISTEYGITPKRSASLLDIFASVFQGILPYSAQVLTAAVAAGITPVETIPYLYYPMLMAVSAICFILFTKDKKAA